MRVFFGLDLDRAAAMTVADWRQRQLACDGRQVPPANFHITLAFVGQIQPPALERLCLSVNQWFDHSPVCGSELTLDCVGYWPKPGIFWLGCSAWPRALTELADKLRGIAVNAGGKRDRNPFQPHVTLFRRCHTAPPAPPTTPLIALPYSHFSLFESRQGRQGVSYHSIEDWHLPSPPVRT